MKTRYNMRNIFNGLQVTSYSLTYLLTYSLTHSLIKVIQSPNGRMKVMKLLLHYVYCVNYSIKHVNY